MWTKAHRNWFARNTFNISMHHLLEHINPDKKGDKAKIRTQQYIKLNTGAKEIQQVNPGQIVRGHRDSRANFMPIYGDLYQIRLKGITNESHLVTHLGFTSGRHHDVIKIEYIVPVPFNTLRDVCYNARWFWTTVRYRSRTKYS